MAEAASWLKVKNLGVRCTASNTWTVPVSAATSALSNKLKLEPVPW
jgi:hypothetical protein